MASGMDQTINDRVQNLEAYEERKGNYEGGEVGDYR